ncbi:MAG: sugar ABC transporter substrate-binding protein [Chloroflexi bacterium]|nr:sugar ABC transporter substrate-binding protein [Chloroflexota bacterium]
MDSNDQMTRRRTLATAAASVPLVVQAAACGGETNPGQSQSTLPPATIEYAYNSGTGPLAEARAAAVDKFMAAVPNIKVHPIPGAPEAQVLEKFKAAAAAGTPPDVVSLNANVYGDLVASKFIAPLDSLIQTRGKGFSRDAFYPEPLNAMAVGGKLYGVPRFVTTMLLFYNKDLFAKAGLAEPNENWTWEREFTTAAQRLSSVMAGEQGFAMGFSADVRNTLVFSWGGEFFDKAGKKCLLDQPKAIAALEFAHGLRYRQRFAPAQGQEGGASFNNGRIAMSVTGSFAYTGLSAVAFKPGVALMPKGPGGRRTSGNATGYSIAEGSKQKEAAWEFIKWLVGDRGQEHLAATETTTPATKKVYPPAGVPAEVTKVFFDALKYGLFFPALRGLSQIMAEINKELNLALNENSRSVRDSAMAAAAAANRLLAAQ